MRAQTFEIRSLRFARWLVPTALAAAGCVSPPPLPPYPSGSVAGVPPSAIQQVAHTASEPPIAPATLPPAVVTLPDAIQECMSTNLRLRAKGEKVQEAM